MQHGPAASSGSNPKAPGSAGGYLLGRLARMAKHLLKTLAAAPRCRLPLNWCRRKGLSSPRCQQAVLHSLLDIDVAADANAALRLPLDTEKERHHQP